MSIIDELRSYRVGTDLVSWHPVICDRAADYITDLLARAEAAEARVEKAEQCIDAIEDDLNRGNDNDWAREHIEEYRGQKEE